MARAHKKSRVLRGGSEGVKNMFSLRAFIRDGFLSAVVHGEMPAYKIMLDAAGWLANGVLTEDDLSEIQRAIEEKGIQEAITGKKSGR